MPNRCIKPEELCISHKSDKLKSESEIISFDSANGVSVNYEHFIKPSLVLTSHGKERDDKLYKIETDDSGVNFDPPPNGVTEEFGSRIRMEDKHGFIPYLIDSRRSLPCIRVVFPSSMHPELVEALSKDPQRKQENTVKYSKREVLHYFGVFDGHGGPQAATHCQERMHLNLKDAWYAFFTEEDLPENGLPEAPTQQADCHREVVQSGRAEETSRRVVEVFKLAFQMTQDQFQLNTPPLVGATAVVALVGRRSILIGYCGDSRAVLYRNDVAYLLTIDHKPDREDETKRIKELGGQVLHYNGARVMGLLAMSRAIGDNSLKPYISHEPEVCILERTCADQVLILATDGLWDVVGHQEACDTALRCLKRSQDKGYTHDQAAEHASLVLAKTAIARGSKDNITVFVIDLNGYDNSTPNR